MNLFDNNSKYSGADFSVNGKYRYKLWRIWDETKPKAMCIGLNPSTANADKNDTTIRYLIKICSGLGYGGFYMMNCWPFISSKPEGIMCHAMTDDRNNELITLTAAQCQDVIFCWGGFKIIKEKGRDKELAEMFPNAKCFGKNADGSPFHPLALMPRNGRNPDNAELFLYNELIK
ncbi:MAG: DUF1643 domain-containing protein [Bacteroidota bacterium]